MLSRDETYRLIILVLILLAIVIFAFWALARGRGEPRQLPFAKALVSQRSEQGSAGTLKIRLHSIDYLVGDTTGYARYIRSDVEPTLFITGTLEHTGGSALRISCPSQLTLNSDGAEPIVGRIDFENSGCWPENRELMTESIRVAVRPTPGADSEEPAGCRRDGTGFCIQPEIAVRFTVEFKTRNDNFPPWLPQAMLDGSLPDLGFVIEPVSQMPVVITIESMTIRNWEVRDYYPDFRPVEGDTGPTGRFYYDTPLSN